MKPTRATHRPAPPLDTDNPWTASGKYASQEQRKRLYLGWLYCPVEEFMRYLEQREAELGIRIKRKEKVS